MADYERPQFPTYDPSIAESMLRASKVSEGLPGYLRISLDVFEPGRLVASMDVRDELRIGLGALHGGVMAALVDHVLGCVLYPLMPRGQWAATTEFKLNYLAAVKTGRLVAESVVLSLGRRSATELRVGDMLDVWRVVDLVVNERLLLQAQMNVFGDAWLEFRLQGTTLVQTAYYKPDGVLGQLCWYAMMPFHAIIFPNMASSIVRRAARY